jgi:hypothetical protein
MTERAELARSVQLVLRSGYALATAVQPRRILILIDAAVSP